MLNETTLRFVLMVGLGVLLAACQGRAGSIFDDDYVPPQRAETPKADVSPTPEPAPTPTPPTAVNPPEAQPAPPPVPAPTANEARRAVPKPAEQAQCRKLFKEAFADQLKDKSPSGRRKLAGVLLTEAAKTTGTPIDYFVLLSGAVQSGEEAGSLKHCFDAIDTLAKSYTFDPLGAKADAAEKVWSSVTATTATVGNVQNAFDLVDALVTDDDFVTAGKVETALQHGLPKISDADLKSAAGNHLRDLETARAERSRLTPKLETLRKTPADPAANFSVGSFWCFTAGKWEKGLPYLARGNDVTIKNLAATELLQSADAEAVAKLADGWWDATAKLTGAARTKTQIHAAGLYRGVVEKLPGLRKLAVEKRIADVPSTDSPRWVDLLELVDPSVDTVNGTWHIENGALVSASSRESRIEFPYLPPEEYDFRAVFTVGSGTIMTQMCGDAGHPFDWVLGTGGNTVAGFEFVNGKSCDNNSTTKRAKRWLIVGQHYVSIIKVRKTGVEALLNGQSISKITDYSDMTVPDWWRLRRDGAVGVGAAESVLQFESIEVIERTGHGEKLR